MTTAPVAEARANISSRETSRAGSFLTGDKGDLPASYFRLALAAIFALSLCLQLYFNFAAVHVSNHGSCDASEYLRNAKALLKLRELPGNRWLNVALTASGLASKQQASQAKEDLSTLKEMHQSGPVFPLFLASTFAISGSSFSNSNEAPPLFAQCVLAALTCLFAALTVELGWHRRAAVIAGFLCAIYPGFIVNSGRLYSESFATFLVTTALYLTATLIVRQRLSLPLLVLAGFNLACLHLTRSIMIVFSLSFLGLVACMFWRRNQSGASIIKLSAPRVIGLIGDLAPVLVGMALVIVPWLAATKVLFDKPAFVIDRVGNYNMFTGNHVESAGWLAYPYPDGQGLEKKSFFKLMKEAIRSNPGGWLKLQGDKLPRLYKHPWNDFRTAIGPLSPAQQTLLHQAIMLLAVIGVVLALSKADGGANSCGQNGWSTSGDRKDSRAQSNLSGYFTSAMAVRLVLAAFWMFHLSYLLFITVPRYNLTSMPAVIAFAAVTLASLGVLWSRNRTVATAIVLSGLTTYLVAQLNCGQLLSLLPDNVPVQIVMVATVITKLAALLALAATIFWCVDVLSGKALIARALVVVLLAGIGPSYILPVYAHGRWFEIATSFDHPGQTLSCNLTIPAEAHELPCYLLIDTDNPTMLGQNITVSLAGQSLDAPVIPGMAMIQDFSQAHMRKHYKLPVEQAYMECEDIFDWLTLGAGTTNASIRQWAIIPLEPRLLDKPFLPATIRCSAVCKHSGDMHLYRAFTASARSLTIPSATVASWEKSFYGVEEPGWLSDSRYNQRIALPAGQSANSEHPAIHLLVAGSKQAAPQSIKNIELHTIKAREGEPVIVRIPAKDLASPDQPAQAASDIWLVRVSGTVSGQNASARNMHPRVSVSAFARSASGNPLMYTSPWSGSELTADARPTNELSTSDRVVTPGSARRFEQTVPFCPTWLPGQLTRLELHFDALSRRQMSIKTQPEPGASVTFNDVKVQIFKLGANPLAPGSKIY